MSSPGGPSTARRNDLVALRRGTVPARGLDLLAVGLDRFGPAIDEELAKVAGGAGVFKAIRGEWGSGKTFASRWIAERARRQGFVTSELQISETETPLHHLQTVYRRLIERIAIGDGDSGVPNADRLLVLRARRGRARRRRGRRARHRGARVGYRRADGAATRRRHRANPTFAAGAARLPVGAGRRRRGDRRRAGGVARRPTERRSGGETLGGDQGRHRPRRRDDLPPRPAGGGARRRDTPGCW